MADAEKSEAAAEEFASLIQKAAELGFIFVDLYMEGEDELIAFTCSSSQEYIETIQNIEMKKRNN